MNRAILILACCVCMLSAPAAAPAALSLGFDYEGPGQSTAFNPSRGVPHYFDLVFRETGTAQPEGLFTYDLVLDLVPPAGGSGVGLLTGAAALTVPADRFVFPTPPDPSILPVESTARRLYVNVTTGADLADIDDGDKAGRLWFTVDPAAPLGVYRLRFDPNSTVFGSGDPNLPLSIDVALAEGAAIVLEPEPGTPALLAAAGLLGLLRRRRHI